MNEMLAFGVPGYIPPEHDVKLRIYTGSLGGYTLTDLTFVNVMPYSSYPQVYFPAQVNYLFSGITDDNITVSAHVTGAGYYLSGHLDYSAFTGNDVLFQQSSYTWKNGADRNITFTVKGPNQSIPTTINSVAVGYYMNQQNIVPDCAYVINNIEPVPPTPTPSPYNPLNLPPNTVRVRTSDGNAPVKTNNTTYETATLVTGTSDVYDVYKSGTDFNKFLNGSSNIIEVLGANTEGIINMSYMFYNCQSLTSVALFDTRSVTNMGYMFSTCYALTTVPLFDTSSVTKMTQMFIGCRALTSVPLFDTSCVTDTNSMFNGCSSLTTIPLFDTSSVTNMARMFYNCTNVQSGALALYQQASTQTTPPSYYGNTFYQCGSNTTTGAAELAQIPSSWGGTGA